MHLTAHLTRPSTAVICAAPFTLPALAQSGANCPNPIPIALTTPLTSGIAWLGNDKAHGVGHHQTQNLY